MRAVGHESRRRGVLSGPLLCSVSPAPTDPEVTGRFDLCLVYVVLYWGHRALRQYGF